MYSVASDFTVKKTYLSTFKIAVANMILKQMSKSRLIFFENDKDTFIISKRKGRAYFCVKLTIKICVCVGAYVCVI